MTQYIESGSMPWQPNFSLTVEGEDITAIVRANLINLTLTDYGGSQKKSDQVSFAVVSQDMKLPAKGVKISIGLGFGQELTDKGTYIVDSTTSGFSTSSPRIIEVTARAFSKSNERGHSTLQSQKTRSFSGVTLGDLVNKVATEHGLTPKVPVSLASIQIPHVDQLGESDMNLLTRLADRYSAVSKVSHDYWILTPREGMTTVDGNALQKLVLTPDMVSTASYYNNSDHPDASSANGGTNVISYVDVTDGGKIKTITVGSGEPVTHSEFPMPSLASAQEVAGSTTTKSKKKLKGMSISLPAAPELMGLTAQCLIETSGFGEVEDQEWHISKLDMTLAEQGFTIKLELE